MPISQILPNGQVVINNTQTGETKTVNAADLGSYSPNLVAQYTQMTANQSQQQQQPPQDLATTVGKGILNLLGNVYNPIANAWNSTAAKNAEITKNNKGPVDLMTALKQGLQQTGNFVTGFEANPKVAADVGQFAIPFGKGAGIVSKALLPGAGVGAAQSFGQGDNPTQILGNAGIGAAGGGVLSAASPVLSKILGGAGKGANAAATDLVKSQFNVTKGVADSNQLGNTINQLSKYGLTNIDDISKIAPKITGDTGIITQLTRDAVGNATPVKLGSYAPVAGGAVSPRINEIAQEMINNEPLISDNSGNKFMGVVNKFMDQNASRGYLTADAGKTFDFIQNLESKASTLRHGNDESRSLAGVYTGVANELRDRLFQNAGADNALISKVLTPETLAKIDAISPQLAKDVQGVKTVGQLRSLAAPFVRGSILAKATENASSNALPGDIGAGITGGAIEALASGGLGPQAIPAGLAALLAKKAVTSNSGKSAISRVLSGAGNQASAGASSLSSVGNSPALSSIIGQLGARGATSISGASTNTGSQAPNTSNQQTNGNSGNQLNNSISQPQDNLITPEQVSQTYLKFGKALGDRMNDAYNAQFGSSNQQNIVVSRQNASRILDNLEQIYYTNNLAQGRLKGNVSQLGAEAGLNPQVRTYENLRATVQPFIARALGDVGNLTASEQEKAVKLLPTSTSTPEEAAQGFAAIRSTLGLPPSKYVKQ